MLGNGTVNASVEPRAIAYTNRQHSLKDFAEAANEADRRISGDWPLPLLKQDRQFRSLCLGCGLCEPPALACQVEEVNTAPY